MHLNFYRIYFIREQDTKFQNSDTAIVVTKGKSKMWHSQAILITAEQSLYWSLEWCGGGGIDHLCEVLWIGWQSCDPFHD